MPHPCCPWPTATSLSRLCDGVLVVVREGFTRRKVLNKALDSIEKSKLLGTVLNQASMLNIDYDRYYGSNNSSGKSKKEEQEGSKEEAEQGQKRPRHDSFVQCLFPYPHTVAYGDRGHYSSPSASCWRWIFWAGTTADASIYLLYENGIGRIGLVVGVFVLLMYYFDLYDSIVLSNRREVVTRLVGVLGCSFVSLAVLYYAFPDVRLGGSTLWIGVAHCWITRSLPGASFFLCSTGQPVSPNEPSSTAMGRWPGR